MPDNVTKAKMYAIKLHQEHGQAAMAIAAAEALPAIAENNLVKCTYWRLVMETLNILDQFAPASEH